MALTDTQRLDAYRGLGGYADGSYLIQHVRESDDKFGRRKKLAKYLNYPRKVIDAYLGTLFGRPAQRSGEAAAWQALQGNADGLGGQIDDLMRRAELLAMLLGTAYLVVDRPAGASLTRADDLKRLPYVVLRKPGDVASLTLDALGAVESVVFAEAGASTTYGESLSGEAAAETRYRGWDRTRWWVSSDVAGKELLSGPDGKPLTGEHGLGRPPVVRHHSTLLVEVTDERASPWAEGLIALADDLYQQWSEKRDLFRSQTFSILILPFKDQSELDRIRENGLAVGTENALPYNPEGGGQPDYLAPPDGPAKLYMEDIAETVKRLYELANLEFTGGVQQSGVALAFHFQAANDGLGLLAQGCEQTEMEIGRLACAWMGEEPGADLRVVYPRKFAVDDLAARLAEDAESLTLELGPTAQRLIRGRSARRVLGDSASAAEYEAIDKELEAGVDPYGDRAAKEGAA
jgi:hypothetical protein